MNTASCATSGMLHGLPPRRSRDRRCGAAGAGRGRSLDTGFDCATSSTISSSTGTTRTPAVSRASSVSRRVPQPPMSAPYLASATSGGRPRFAGRPCVAVRAWSGRSARNGAVKTFVSTRTCRSLVIGECIGERLALLVGEVRDVELVPGFEDRHALHQLLERARGLVPGNRLIDRVCFGCGIGHQSSVYARSGRRRKAPQGLPKLTTLGSLDRTEHNRKSLFTGDPELSCAEFLSGPFAKPSAPVRFRSSPLSECPANKSCFSRPLRAEVTRSATARADDGVYLRRGVGTGADACGSNVIRWRLPAEPPRRCWVISAG